MEFAQRTQILKVNCCLWVHKVHKCILKVSIANLDKNYVSVLVIAVENRRWEKRITKDGFVSTLVIISKHFIERKPFL